MDASWSRLRLQDWGTVLILLIECRAARASIDVNGRTIGTREGSNVSRMLITYLPIPCPLASTGAGLQAFSLC